MKAIAIFNPEINNGITGKVVFTQKTRDSNTEIDINLSDFVRTFMQHLYSYSLSHPHPFGGKRAISVPYYWKR